MARQKNEKAVEVSQFDESSGLNLVVLQGHLSSEPVTRELTSGDIVMNMEVITPTGLGRFSVPVVAEPSLVRLSGGSAVVVVGHVRRRFFRSGTGVQSRTEVVAETVVLATHAAKVRKLVQEAVEYLDFLTQ